MTSNGEALVLRGAPERKGFHGLLKGSQKKKKKDQLIVELHSSSGLELIRLQPRHVPA
jgi:hypothetical protein